MDEPNVNTSNLMNNTTSQSNFTLLLSKKYRKQYHLVDAPALSYELALKSYESSDINKIKNKISNSQPIFGVPKQMKLRKAHSQVRNFYKSLRNQVECTLKKIYNSLQKHNLGLTQVFEYNQVVLKGFLEAYLQQLRKNCQQESQFMKYIWNQTLKLMESIIKLYVNKFQKSQKDGLQQILEIHEKYQSSLEAQIKKKDSLKQQIKNLNEIVNYLVTKLRIKRKQIKKLYRSEGELINNLNAFKDKTIDGQIKYLDLKIETQNLSEPQLQRLLQKKKDLINFRNQMLKLQQNKMQRLNEINNQINIQGQIDIKQFINQANTVFKQKNINNASVIQMQAQFDEAFDTLQERFEQKQFRMKKIAKHGFLSRIPSTITLSKGVMAQPQKISMKQKCVETTYSDKLNNDAINSIGVMVAPQKKRIILKNQQICCRYQDIFHGKIQQVIQISLQCQGQQVMTPLQDKNNAFKIKYIQKKQSINKSNHNFVKPYSNKLIQCNGVNNSLSDQDFQMQLKPSSITSFDSQNKLKNSQKRKSVRKSQFLRRESMIKVNQNFGNKQVIKSRFSSIHASPQKKNIKDLQSRRKQSLVFQPTQFKNKPINNQNQSYQPIVVRKKGYESIINKSRKKSMESRASFRSKESQKFTSLSRKTQVQLPQNVQELLNSTIPKQNIVEQQYQEFETAKRIERNQLIGILDDLSDISFEQQKQRQRRSEKGGKNMSQDDLQISEIQRIERAQKSLKNSIKSIMEYNRDQKKMKKQRGSLGIVQNMIQSVVKRKLKFKKFKPTQDIGKQNSFVQKMQPIADDVKKKIKECTFKTNKMLLPVKHKNILTIISSVLSRTWERFSSLQPCNNLIAPLFETMRIIYGNIPDNEIYKKVINFIAQTMLQDQKICKVFIFFLTLDQNNVICKKITTFETFLFLKLITQLSKVSNPFKELDYAYTYLECVQQRLQGILAQQNLPDILYQRILANIKSTFDEDKLISGQQTKISLFVMSKKIIEYILETNLSVRKTFENFIELHYLLNSGKGILLDEVKKFISSLCISRKQYLKYMKKLHIILQNNIDYVSGDIFIALMLRLKILSFEDFYIRNLTKFGIRSQQIWNYLQQMKQIMQWDQNLRKIKEYNTICQKGKQIQNRQIERIQDISLLNHVQKMTENVLQSILGKPMNKLYGVSIILIQ